MPTAIKEKVPNNNNKDEEKVNDEEEPLYSKVDDELILAVTNGGSIEIVIKTNKHSIITEIKPNVQLSKPVC